MAHFAEISDQNHVLRVLVVPDAQESRGAQFLASDLGLGGVWVQCSYNGSFRKQHPGKGYKYDPDSDVFISPQPYPSWSLDSEYEWKAPVPIPDDGNDYVWDETSKSWLLAENAP